MSVKSLTCIYAVISGLSSNSEFLHFRLFIDRSLNLISSPFFNLTKVFLELILSKILKSVKFPSILSCEIEILIKKNKIKNYKNKNLIYSFQLEYFFLTAFLFLFG